MRRTLVALVLLIAGCGTNASATLSPPALTREHASVVEYERRQKELQTPGAQVYFNDRYPLQPGRIAYGHCEIVEIMDEHQALAEVNGARVVVSTDTSRLEVGEIIGYEKPLMVGDPVRALSQETQVYSVVPVDLESILGVQHPLP